MPFGAAMTGGPVRIMIVEDSAVVRSLMGRWIAAEPGFAVVAAAADGRAALDLVDEAQPDIVLLDLAMPVLDGVATLPLLLRQRPGMSVVVVSTLTQRNAVISLRCLAAGAVDCLPKPSGRLDSAASATFRAELIAKLQGLTTRHRRREVGAAVLTGSEVTRLLEKPGTRAEAILIGASTGGPRAVIQVLRGLAAAAERAPILIVQHMPPIFTAVFAVQITAETGIHAAEGRDGESVEPGRVYLAPGGTHMGLARTGGQPTIRLDHGPPVRHCRPAVDVLLREAAEIYGGATVAAVLTGMGTDGLEGARAITQAGGTVIAQDEESSVVWGMPGSVVKAGLARLVLPLADIAGAIEARTAPRSLDRPLRRAVA